MILPWMPVILIDMAGSALTLGLAVWCAILAWQWSARKPTDVFRSYLALLTIAIVVFAVSRSCGHLLKQLLLMNDLKPVWKEISPYSGAINTLVFMVIFAFGIYFHRFQQIHEEIEHYRQNLESLIVKRTSELAAANATLADEHEQLAVTLRSIGDGVITTDINGKVVMLNKVAEELTGWRQREAVGRCLSEVFKIINENTLQPCQNPVELVMASGKIIGLANHTALISRDGVKRSIADSGAPIRDQESRIIGVVLVFRDVTREIRMDQELQKIEKLESIGILAGGIAHDFNNILTAILANINLAKRSLQPGAELHEMMLSAEKACLRATGLTRQLLTFAKGGEPVKETAAIPEIIKESTEFVLHGGNIICQYEIAADLWLVEIDKGQMSQVIQNLIINAKHAMPQGGVIQIKGENVLSGQNEPVPLPGERRHIKIALRDNGTGIPQEMLGNIFDPYFSTKEKGSGLGLAITHAIIKKHGGLITVNSVPDQGTTFTIYLPVAADQHMSLPFTAVAHSFLPGSRRVLVMDDEAMIREIAAKILGILGYEVLLAEDGNEALEIFRQAWEQSQTIDLVIMDLTIPGGMGGKEAVREILHIDPQAKVIVTSGYSNDPVMANYQAYGFIAAIIKPFCLQDLEEKLRQAFTLTRPQDQA